MTNSSNNFDNPSDFMNKRITSNTSARKLINSKDIPDDRKVALKMNLGNAPLSAHKKAGYTGMHSTATLQ